MSDIETQAPPADPAVADTSAPVDQSEASTQTNEAPEATQQQEETAEIKATDTAEDKLYAGKYKSPEDMEKAYKELESKFGQTTSEKAELSRILNEAFANPAPAQAKVQEDIYSDEPDPVNQEIENLKRVTAVQSFVMNHPEADAAALQTVLSTDPYVKQISGHEAKLEYAYLRSQNMAQSKAIAEAEKKGAQATQAKIAEKQVAQVEAAQKAVPTDEEEELLVKAVGGSPADAKAARAALIRKHLVNL